MSSANQKSFFTEPRPAQSFCNERCQNILYKAVFEHFMELSKIAALLLTSKSFQNSSFGANFLSHFIIDHDSIPLFKNVLTPSSCFSLQFAPCLNIRYSNEIWPPESKPENYYNEMIKNINKFVAALANSKYFRLQLRSLSLEDSEGLCDLRSFFGSWISWTQLRDLNLIRFESLDDESMSLMSKSAEHLASLQMTFCQGVGPVGFQAISELSSITSLDLKDSPMVTHEHCLECVAQLSKVTFLNLSWCSVTDHRLEQVAKLANLVTLDLSHNRWLTDAGLAHVAKLSRLTSLNLTHDGLITKVGAEHLSKLSNLVTLNLSWCQKITDAGLEHIAKLTNLTSVDFSYCGVDLTEEGKQKCKDCLPYCVFLKERPT